MELGERTIKTVGNGLLLTFIYICGKTDAQYCYHRRRGGHLKVEVDSVILAVSSHEATEAATQAGKTGDGCVYAHTNGDDAEHNERNGHRQRCLMRSVVSVKLLVLSAPEDAVV